MVKLNLVGHIVLPWNIPRDLYAGFLELEKGKGTFTLELERNSAVDALEVKTLAFRSDAEWLKLEKQVITADAIVLDFLISADEASVTGAVRSEVGIDLVNEDGTTESYTANIYMHISRD